MLRCALPVVVLASVAATAPGAAQQSFGTGHVEREGAKTAHGPHVPPRTRIRVVAGMWRVPPRARLAGHATILSHDPALPALTLPIVKLHSYRREECTGELEKTRRVEFPDVLNDAYRAYVVKDSRRGPTALPAVLVVHPAAPNARTLTPQSVAAADLPDGFPLSTLEAAFDLSGSGKAEIVQLRYCCHDPRLDGAQCIKPGGKDGGSRCMALFHKGKAGWRRHFFAFDEDC